MAALSLKASRTAIRRLEKRIDELRSIDVSAPSDDYNSIAQDLRDKTNAMLSQLFGQRSIELKQYAIDDLTRFPPSLLRPIRLSEGEKLAAFREIRSKSIQSAVSRLASLISLLKEHVEAGNLEEANAKIRKALSQRHPYSQQTEQIDSRPKSENKVFIVHGHDDYAKEATARLISDIGLDPIILHEQANRGKTIIEKFEANADVAFAVVLLTPDDEAHPKGRPNDKKHRARQNVVLELGYFMAKLGRDRVCALHKGDIEHPSDVDGIVYVPIDDSGVWRFMLAREMKEAGLGVDLNRVK